MAVDQAWVDVVFMSIECGGDASWRSFVLQCLSYKMFSHIHGQEYKNEGLSSPKRM
jgi:hypothetical protein